MRKQKNKKASGHLPARAPPPFPLLSPLATPALYPLSPVPFATSPPSPAFACLILPSPRTLASLYLCMVLIPLVCMVFSSYLLHGFWFSVPMVLRFYASRFFMVLFWYLSPLGFHSLMIGSCSVQVLLSLSHCIFG